MPLLDSAGHLGVLIFWTFSISMILDPGETSLHLLTAFPVLRWIDGELAVFPVSATAGSKPELSLGFFVSGGGFH